LEDFAETLLQAEFLLDHRDEHVNADRDPYFNPDRVVARSVKGFNMQILLDPFEKQLDLPSPLVELRNRNRWQCKVVRQEHETSVVFLVVE
jgi:hypothetical protein